MYTLVGLFITAVVVDDDDICRRVRTRRSPRMDALEVLFSTGLGPTCPICTDVDHVATPRLCAGSQRTQAVRAVTYTQVPNAPFLA